MKFMKKTTIWLLVGIVVIIAGVIALKSSNTESPLGSPKINTTAYPDLIVSNITILSTMHNATAFDVNITAVISNIGNAGAGFSITKFFVNRGGGTRLVGTPPIGALSTREVVTSYLLPVNGTYIVNVTADFGNNVTESNEGNNVLGKVFLI